MAVIRIGLISDTHSSQGEAVKSLVAPLLQNVQLILHAGDITDLSVIHALEQIAPVDAVHGNMDSSLVHAELPAERIIRIDGIRIGLTHGGGAPDTIQKRVLALFQDQVDVIVFGHTHEPLVKRVGKVLLVNPGSPTDRYGRPRGTVGLLEVDEGHGVEAHILSTAPDGGMG